MSEAPQQPTALHSEAQDALNSPNLAAAIRYRLEQIEMGYDQATDDAVPYGHMLRNISRNFLQPMMDRTSRPHISPQSLVAAAIAATKLAALCLAFADKCHRHASRMATEATENTEDFRGEEETA